MKTIRLDWRDEVLNFDTKEYNPAQTTNCLTAEDIDYVLCRLTMASRFALKREPNRWLCVGLAGLFMTLLLGIWLGIMSYYRWEKAVEGTGFFIASIVFLSVSLLKGLIDCQTTLRKQALVKKELELKEIAGQLNRGYLQERRLFVGVGALAEYIYLEEVPGEDIAEPRAKGGLIEI